ISGAAFPLHRARGLAGPRCCAVRVHAVSLGFCRAGVLACCSMRTRAGVFPSAIAAAVAAISGAAWTHASPNLMVGAPKLLPYQAPDIDDITGIDSDDADAAPAPGSAQNPQQASHK